MIIGDRQMPLKHFAVLLHAIFSLTLLCSVEASGKNVKIEDAVAGRVQITGRLGSPIGDVLKCKLEIQNDTVLLHFSEKTVEAKANSLWLISNRIPEKLVEKSEELFSLNQSEVYVTELLVSGYHCFHMMVTPEMELFSKSGDMFSTVICILKAIPPGIDLARQSQGTTDRVSVASLNDSSESALVGRFGQRMDRTISATVNVLQTEDEQYKVVLNSQGYEVTVDFTQCQFYAKSFLENATEPETLVSRREIPNAVIYETVDPFLEVDRFLKDKASGIRDEDLQVLLKRFPIFLRLVVIID